MATSTQTTYDVDIADVEYLRHGDQPLLARLFTPRGSGPFPLMVELHGGAWVRGDRLNGNAPNEALAQHGVIVVALDFRVPPVAPYPASLADIHYGIRWCKTQAVAWHGRPDWIGAMGTSSGAHQAMLLGMRPHDPRYAALALPAGNAGVDGTLGCVILCSPVIDPLGRYLYAKGLRQDCTPPAGFADRVVPMHDQYWQTEEAMAEGAPARILARGVSGDLKLLSNGQGEIVDSPVPFSSSTCNILSVSSLFFCLPRSYVFFMIFFLPSRARSIIGLRRCRPMRQHTQQAQV